MNEKPEKPDIFFLVIGLFFCLCGLLFLYTNPPFFFSGNIKMYSQNFGGHVPIIAMMIIGWTFFIYNLLKLLKLNPDNILHRLAKKITFVKNWNDINKAFFILTCFFLLLSTGIFLIAEPNDIQSEFEEIENKFNDNINKLKSNIHKSTFKHELIFEGDGDKYYHPDSSLYYNIGSYEVKFIPADTPTIIIPGWRLLICKDTVLFIKPILSSNINSRIVKDTNNPIKFSTISNGLLCQDTKKTKAILENTKKKLIISDLGETRFFEYRDQNNTVGYLISYHHCLLPDLKIFRIRN